MKIKKIWFPLIVFVFLGLQMGGIRWVRAAEPTEKLTIGVSASMSGPAAQWGFIFERASKLAIDDINTKGGVIVGGKKYTFELKSYDHAYDPSKAVENAKRMMKIDNVSCIVTHGAGATLPIIPYTEENKTLVFSIATGEKLMKQKLNYFFRIANFLIPEAGYLLWDWLAPKRPEIKTVAFIYPDDASGWEDAKSMKEVFSKHKIKVVNESFYKRGITDFYPALTGILLAKPDCIDLGTNPPADQGRILKQVREMGFKGLVVAPCSPDAAVSLEIAKGAAEGFIGGSTVDPKSPRATPEEKMLAEKWDSTVKTPYTGTVSVVAGCIYLFTQAMQKVNGLDPDKVANSLHTSEFIKFGRKVYFGGNSVYGPPPKQIIESFGIYEVVGGKLVMVGISELPRGY